MYAKKVDETALEGESAESDDLRRIGFGIAKDGSRIEVIFDNGDASNFKQSLSPKQAKAMTDWD